MVSNLPALGEMHFGSVWLSARAVMGLLLVFCSSLGRLLCSLGGLMVSWWSFAGLLS